MRHPDSKLGLANFMRTHLYSSLATLKYGLDILFKEEHVTLDKLMGHGGFFKTKGVGQRIMAAAADVPVSVMETAGEAVPGVSRFWRHTARIRSRDRACPIT
mgnify:FL=1